MFRKLKVSLAYFLDTSHRLLATFCSKNNFNYLYYIICPLLLCFPIFFLFFIFVFLSISFFYTLTKILPLALSTSDVPTFAFFCRFLAFLFLRELHLLLIASN